MPLFIGFTTVIYSVKKLLSSNISKKAKQTVYKSSTKTVCTQRCELFEIEVLFLKQKLFSTVR